MRFWKMHMGVGEEGAGFIFGCLHWNNPFFTQPASLSIIHFKNRGNSISQVALSQATAMFASFVTLSVK